MKRLLTSVTLAILGFGSLASFAGIVIKVDGSTTVYPITEAVAEEFQKTEAGKTNVTVGQSGTGGGFKKFCAGETDISDASRPIKPTEVVQCGKNSIDYIELPVAFDGLTVAVNPANTWVDFLTVEELNRMWGPDAQGKIMKWSQVRKGWPDTPLALFGATPDNGTFDYFTEAVTGKAGASRTDYRPSVDSNVRVQGITSEEGGLGYFGYAYYDENKDKLKAVAIAAGAGRPAVAPSYETIKDLSYQPLSRPLFIYVNRASIRKPEVKRFVEFYLHEAARFSKEVGYVALPDTAYVLAAKRFSSEVTGSIFGGQGATVGVKIEDLLAKEK